MVIVLPSPLFVALGQADVIESIVRVHGRKLKLADGGGGIAMGAECVRQGGGIDRKALTVGVEAVAGRILPGENGRPRWSGERGLANRL